MDNIFSAERQRGFTLVELAIVLVIIGILVGGILRGYELIANAEVTATVQQIKSFQTAKHAFADQYSAIPGDMGKAEQRLPHCDAGNACVSGNSDNQVGDAYYSFAEHPYNGGIATENTQFWKHLALSHLITGINPSATAPNFGVSHPSAKIGGGYVLYHNLKPDDQGLFLTIQSPIRAWTTPWLGKGQNPLTPIRAEQIDRKLDDGLPETGDVMGYPADDNCKTTAGGKTTYVVTNESKDCVLSFIMN